MTNQTLEKMAWLYAQGFEPDCKISLGDKDYSITPANKDSFNFICDDPCNCCDYPYFSESTLWSLLPERTVLDDTIFFRKLNTHIMYEPTYFTIDEKAGKPPLSCLYIKEANDLHTALLDLTIWAVKEGHLKAEVKSE